MKPWVDFFDVFLDIGKELQVIGFQKDHTHRITTYSNLDWHKDFYASTSINVSILNLQQDIPMWSISTFPSKRDHWS